MRILHVNNTASVRGGIEVYLQDLFRGLARRGIESILACETGEGGEHFGGLHRIAGLTDSPLLRMEDRAFRGVASLARDLRPDIIHVHNVLNVNAIESCLRVAPVFLHFHDYLYVCPAGSFHFLVGETNCQRTAGAHCVLRGCAFHCVSRRPDVSIPGVGRTKWVAGSFQRFAGLLANSNRMRERIMAAGAPATLLSVLHYPCSYENLAPIPRPAMPRYILFVGRLTTQKGTEDFVRCLGFLPPDIRGVMIGQGTNENLRLIQRVAEEVGCSDRLEIRPWLSRTEVAETMSSASVTVFPSIWEEPFGLVGVESQMLGVPVVGYGHGGALDWLEDGVTGLAVSPRDPKGLARCVSRVLEDPDLARRLAAEARYRAVTRFGLDRHLDQLIELYSRSKSRRPS
jgi:glycosyltransferase involved in cell wall biosynthesis